MPIPEGLHALLWTMLKQFLNAKWSYQAELFEICLINKITGHKIGISAVVLIGARVWYDVKRVTNETLIPVIRAFKYRSSFCALSFVNCSILCLWKCLVACYRNWVAEGK